MGERIDILGVGIDRVNNQEALQCIRTFIASGKPHRVITANPEIIYRAQNDEKMHNMVQTADLVTADGAGVVWASRQLGQPLQERVTGIDLVNLICAQAAKENWKIYILGSAPGVAATAAINIQNKFPGCSIVGTHHGYFDKKEEKRIIAELEQLRPDVLFVALGAPKQEYWIADHIQHLQIPVGMGIGGSMDVLSGNIRRAPKLMQKLNVEWLYRLITQPTRFKRMLVLPKFMVAVKKQVKKQHN